MNPISVPKLLILGIIEFVFFVFLNQSFNGALLMVALVCLSIIGVRMIIKTLPDMVSASVKSVVLGSETGDYRPQARSVSAVLLAFPGFLTAAFGILILLPGINRYAGQRVTSWVIGSRVGIGTEGLRGRYNNRYTRVVDVESSSCNKENQNDSPAHLTDNSGE